MPTSQQPPVQQDVIWLVAGDGIGQPAVQDDRVIFGGRRGDLIAVDRKSGRPLWTAQSPDGSTTRGTLTNLVLLDGRVVSGTRELSAFNTSDGTLAWTFKPSRGEGSGLFGMTSDGSSIYAGSNSGRVFAVDGRTGAERWQRVISTAPEGVQVFAPALHDSIVVAGYRIYTSRITGGLVALDARDGRVLWQRTFTSADPFKHTGSLGHVGFFGDAVICGPDNGQVYSLALRDGSTNWVTPRHSSLFTASDPNYVAVVDSFVVTGDADGYLRGFDARTGRLLWTSRRVNGAALIPMVARGRHVYVSTFGGSLVEVRASDGTIEWEYPRSFGRENTIAPYPAISSDTIFVPSANGLLALRRR